MDTVDRIVNQKGTAVHTIGSDASVKTAVEKMSALHIGAILVVDGDSPQGIFSERDLMVRVILANRPPETTTVAEVMTRDLICVEPGTETEEAMAVMSERRCRHLPVVDRDGTLQGLVSIGDLVRWQSRDHKFQIRMLTDYICGRYPG